MDTDTDTDLGVEYSVIDTFSPLKPTELARTSQTPILTSEECFDNIDECGSHYYRSGSSNDRYG